MPATSPVPMHATSCTIRAPICPMADLRREWSFAKATSTCKVLCRCPFLLYRGHFHLQSVVSRSFSFVSMPLPPAKCCVDVLFCCIEATSTWEVLCRCPFLLYQGHFHLGSVVSRSFSFVSRPLPPGKCCVEVLFCCIEATSTWEVLCLC